MLLAYREDPSFFAVAHALGVHHQTVQRCVERALAYGPMAALDDRPRSGKEPTITTEAKRSPPSTSPIGRGDTL
jgi:Winged helix-turn helix